MDVIVFSYTYAMTIDSKRPQCIVKAHTYW